MSEAAPAVTRQPLRQQDLENRFAAVTHDRLRRVMGTLTPRQQDFVEMIPLLFHLNHPLLPGFVSVDTPHGIADFMPSREAQAAARRLVRSFTFEAHTQRSYPIRGLYLMGSAGTVAYSRDSDLDIWVCHAPDLTQSDLALLKRKAQGIEAFAANQSVEVHFYVFDPERFRRGETLGLSADSSGSSQHHLLLDEFYRSGLLLAGLKPMWWHVPPAEETRYDTFVEAAVRQRKIAARHYVDFGGLPSIPAAEFFGAALWQLYKSIDSPYKSVMKLLLMESYAADYPDLRLLSHRYKQTLTGTSLKLDDLDPYLAMYRRIEDYLMGRGDHARLALLRRAFYLKTDEKLSVPVDPRLADWRRETLEAMVAAWGWTPREILALDRRDQWRIDTAREERRELVKALQKSYAVLSEFARRHGDAQHITATDLTILGRKLYAAFEKKPHKLELITRGICQNPAEPALSIHLLPEPGGTGEWHLFEGRVEGGEEGRANLLRRGESLVELLAWCHFNRLVGASTEWHLFEHGRRASLNGLRRVLEALGDAFPTHCPATGAMSDLARPPHATSALFLVNVGCDVTPARLAEGDVLTSSHSDALRFGGSRSTLVARVDLVLETSWGELFCHRHAGPDALLQAAARYLEVLSPTRAPAVAIGCFTPDYGHLIRQRVTRVLEDLGAAFTRQARDRSLHYILGIGDSYHEILRRDGRIETRAHGNTVSLFKSLGEASPGFREVHFDANCRAELPLAEIYTHNRPGRVQMFAAQRGPKLDIYVTDEHGDLYVERQVGQLLGTAVDHFGRFFQGLAALSEDGAGAPVDWFQLAMQGSAGWRAQALSAGPNRAAPYIALRVEADIGADDQPMFVCRCADQEFSSATHGSGLFAAIAAHILAARASGERYPVYITELALTPRYATRHGSVARRTARLLEFKKRIEYHLTKALRLGTGN